MTVLALTRALAILALAVWLPSAVAEAAPLRLAVSRGPVSLPVYVAEAQGFFQREALAVQVSDCTSGRQCFQMLQDGQADLATAAELLVTLDSFDSAGVGEHPIIATLSSSSHHIKLVARRGAGITAPADLRGKRIATVAGTSAQYFLDSWLVFHEIDPAALRVLPLAPDRLVEALQRGEADAIAIWEPIASAAIAALGADALVLPSPRIYTQHFSLIASREGIASHRVELVKLLRALERAERFIAAEPAQAQRILAAQFQGQGPGEVGPARMAEHEFRLTLGQSLIATMEGQARWAVRQRQLPAGRPPANLLRGIDASLLRQAVPGAVDLVE